MHEGTYSPRLKVLYLFAGLPRKGDIKSKLLELCTHAGCTLEMTEVDLMRSQYHDMSDDDLWQPLLERIRQGEFDVIIMSPPCSTWSRAVWSNKQGPQPVRSAEFPYGFPWLTGALKDKAVLGTLLVQRCIEILQQAPKKTACLWEHPENLGRTRNGLPASVWQLAELRAAAKARSMSTIALHQCVYGADYSKPTRLLADLPGLRLLGFPGWPQLNKEGWYLGPLPRSCGHAHPPLIGADLEGNFKTSPTAAYPPDLCKAIADLIWKYHISGSALTPPEGGCETPLAGPNKTDKGEEEEVQDPSQELWIPETVPTGDAVHWNEYSGGGHPMRHGKDNRRYHDGAGLCSQGALEPQDRVVSPFAKLGDEWLRLVDDDRVRKDLYNLALGRCKGPPFGREVVVKAKELWLLKLQEISGRPKGELEVIAPRQPFLLSALHAHLEALEDPDSRVFEVSDTSFQSGVQVGVQDDMPRVPEVFEAKEKWKKYEPVPWPCDKDNYSSASDNAVIVQKQFRAEEEKGAMIEIEEDAARRKYGARLRVAALAALEKSDNSFRIVHDGTHGVGVNAQIKVLDQLRYPGPGEIKRAVEALYPPTFCLAADISRAHRLVRVKEGDWGLMACRTGVNDDGSRSSKIWLNCVGTFGIVSASYHFTRLFAGVVRAATSMTGKRPHTLLTYVDDLLFMSKGLEGMKAIWICLLFMLVVGSPFSWHKFGGGLQAEWIGFEINVKERQLRMTEKRMRWAREWCTTVAENRFVKIDECRSALGRLAFMMSAFEHLKPFLGPIYSWVSAVDHCTALQVPAGIVVILEFLKRTMVPGVARTIIHQRAEEESDHWFRSDAKAQGEEIVIGGWCCGDSKDRSKCRWFSLRLDRHTAPWAYQAGEPFRTIAALELLGTLASLKAFPEREARPGDQRRFLISAGTDNLGNRHLVTRFLTTKFPICIVLMQLAWILHEMGLDLRLDWIPRLQNREADALTNLDFSGFDPDKRVHLRPEDLLEEEFKLLMEKGSALYKEIRETKAKRKSADTADTPIVGKVPRSRR